MISDFCLILCLQRCKYERYLSNTTDSIVNNSLHTGFICICKGTRRGARLSSAKITQTEDSVQLFVQV